MADKMGMDSLLEMLLMRKIAEDKDLGIDVLTLKVTTSPVSIHSSISGNMPMLEDIPGAKEWFKETSELLDPIMKEQTTKFAELYKKHMGVQTFEASEEYVAKSNALAKLLASMLEK